MSPLDLTFAVLVLLITPGPTNSLMLIAGAERGMTGALRLIPMELLGYFITIVPLVLIGAALLAEQPGLQAAVTIAAAVWVAVLAVRLWRLPAALADLPSVGARTLLVTTALNPKALIFGLVLLPSPERLAANLVLFAVLVVLVAVLWTGLGAALRNGGGNGGLRQPRAMMLMRRLASVWLAAMSLVLALRGAGV